MKKILILVLTSIIFISCNKDSNNDEEFLISGQVDSYFDGKQVNIVGSNSLSSDILVNDSVKVKNGMFKFKGYQKYPILANVFFKDSSGNFDQNYNIDAIIIEPGKITINSEKKDSLFLIKAKGTKTNDEKNSYNEFIEPYVSAINEMYSNAKNEEDYTFIKEKHDELDLIISNYIKDNPEKNWSLLIVTTRYINGYPLEGLEPLFNNLDDNLKKSEIGIEFQETIERNKKFDIGQSITDFDSKNEEGVNFNLMNSLGSKATILDFWASWCGPCREEHPNLVELYKKYNESGLEIISYSLDDSEKKWKNAIEDDNMIWKHSSNLKGFQDEVAKTYQINSVPKVYILDSNGIIVSKDIRGEELMNKIAELVE